MKRSTLIALSMCCVLVLTGQGCTQEDKDLVFDFAMDWAELNGLVNSDGSPTLLAVARTLGGVSTGDPELDATIDNANTVKKMQEAEDNSQDARRHQDSDPPNYEAATNSVGESIDLRPDDWHYRNQRIALLAAQGKGSDGDNNASARACENQGQAMYERCMESMSRDRVNELEYALTKQRETNSEGLANCEIHYQLYIAYANLASYDAERENIYLTAANGQLDTSVEYNTGCISN